MSSYRTFTIVAALAVSASLSGCAWLSSVTGMPGLAGPDYRTQGQTTKARPLEVPPDLTRPIGDDRFVVPDLKATTYSQYTRDRSGQPVVASNSSVLPRFDSARIVRNGDQHWLVVKGAPDKLWPAVREFWIESGFIMRRETPEAGVMETDWAEDRSKIPQDAVRNTVGRLLDGLYSSGERDKFRTRLDLGTEPGTTEIFVSHRGLEEYYSNPDQLSTAWRFRPTDKTLEFEMLSRLMVKLGAAADRPTAVASTVTAPSTQARATYDKQGSGPLVVNEAFDRSWRRVGLALDRSGFTVEDRDRSKGTFFVRYIDPEQDAKSPKAKGWLDRLAFWRDDAPAERLQLRIKVTESGSNSLVEVQGADGKPDSSATAKRILALLYDQLR